VWTPSGFWLAGWLANRYLPFLARERETAPADLFSSSFYSGRLHTAADRVPKQTNHHLLSCPSRPSPPPLPPLTHGAIYNQSTDEIRFDRCRNQFINDEFYNTISATFFIQISRSFFFFKKERV
jgi:hypothetical protein